MPYTQTSTKTQRVIFKCTNKACKLVFGFEYTKPVFSHEPRWFNGHIVKETYPCTERDIVRTGSSLAQDSSRGCPNCKARVTYNKVSGVYDETVKCGGRCLNATNGECECSCGGENHGKNHCS